MSGIDNFNQIVRFDQTDLLSNTNQIEFSLTNRLLAKDKNGTVTDFLTWQLRYDRYFDPTFGGAVTTGQRNVIESEVDLTGFAFLDRPRNYSPIVSVIRLQSRIGFEWRTDYDPLYHRLTNSSVARGRACEEIFLDLGHTEVHTDPVLLPSANQLPTIGYGIPMPRDGTAAFRFTTIITRASSCSGICR